jgi:flagellar protein FliO/FliZ
MRTLHAIFPAAVLGCLLTAPAAFAAASGEDTPLSKDALSSATKDTSSHVASSGGGLVRTIVGLAVVLGVIYGLYWVLKQVKSSKEEKASGQGLAAIATLPLGPNRTLQLVRAGRELVLVGVSEHGVTPVRTYTEEEAEAVGLLDAEDRDDDTPSGAEGSALRRAIEDLRRKTVRT